MGASKHYHLFMVGLFPVALLSCDIEMPANFSGTVNHWIPNTGDNLDSLAIKLTATDSAGGAVQLTDTLADILFLPPLDQNWDPVEDPIDANNANIRRNRGTCTYSFFAHTPGNADYQDIARFKRNENPADVNTTFTIDWSGIGENNGLRVDANGYLYYFNGANQYNRFAVSVNIPSGGTIRPGDDMKLRFALAENSNVIAVASDGDFLALYDKKLVWRANLYINEGANDWNNQNLWNGADNAWNTNGNGGQIPFSSWTLPYLAGNQYFDSYLNNGQPIRQIHTSMPYSWGCADSPQDVNADLLDQMNCLNISRGNWVSILAPDDEWDNYAHLQRQANGITYYPYRPVYTSILEKGAAFANVDTGGYQPALTAQSAGVDCNGFIQRSASYSGNSYTIRDVRWDGAAAENRLLWGHYSAGIKIGIDVLPNNSTADSNFYDGSWQVYDANNLNGDRNLVIPGDIITMNGHIAFVCNVLYTDNTNRLLPAVNIFVIEADSPDDQWQVIKKDTRTLSFFAAQAWFSDANHHVEVRRLIIN